MSGTTMRASVLLTLEDQLSGGLDRLSDTLDKFFGGFDKIDKVVAAFGGSTAKAGDAMTSLTDRLNATAKVETELADTMKALAGGVTDATDALTKLSEKLENSANAAKQETEKVGAFERALRTLGETAGGVGQKLDEIWAKGEKIWGHEHGGGGIAGLGAALAGVSIVEPVKEYAEYENTLRHIAITQGKSGGAVDVEIKRLQEMFAKDAQLTGQSSESIAKAYFDLQRMGIPTSTIDEVIGAHSRISTAYNTTAEELGPALGALLQNMHVSPTDAPNAMAAMAQAAKEGRFKVEDFSREFPGISGFMSTLGMGGRAGADYGFAALETVMKNASNPGQGAADFTDALNYLTSGAAKHAFGKAGIDLPKLLRDGEKAGRNPMDTVLDKLAQMTKGKSPVEMGEILHAVLHNQQAEASFVALLQHRDEFEALRKKLDTIDHTTVDRDFQTAVSAPITQTRLLTENVEQFMRAIGEDFEPGMKVVNGVLADATEAIRALNTEFPKLTPIIGGAVAAIVSFGSAIGLISLIAGGPVALAIAAIAAVAVAAVEIYEHWAGIKAFFGDLWGGVKNAAASFGSWFEASMPQTAARLRAAWGDITPFFSGLWAGVTSGASGFFDWFGRAVPNVIAPFKTAWSAFAAWLPPALDTLLGGVLTIIGTELHLWYRAFTDPIGLVKDAWSVIVPFFGDLWTGIEATATAWAAWLESWISGAIAGYVGLLRAIWMPVLGFFGDLWTGIEATATAWAAWLESWISGAIAGYVGLLRAVWMPVLGFFGDLWTGIEATATAWTAWLDGWISGAMTAAIEKLKAAWAGLKDWFAGLWHDIIAPFDALAERLAHLLPSLPGMTATPAPPAATPNGAHPVVHYNAHGFATMPAPPPAKVDLNVTVTGQPGVTVTQKSNGQQWQSDGTTPDGRVLGRD